MRLLTFFAALAAATTAPAQFTLVIPETQNAIPYYSQTSTTPMQAQRLAPLNQNHPTGCFFFEMELQDSLSFEGEYYQQDEESQLIDMTMPGVWDGKIEGRKLAALLTYGGTYTFFFSSENRPSCQTILQVRTDFVPPIFLKGERCNN